MADDTNQYPINSDAALTSDDPQSQVASQGWQQIGQTAPVQQAMDVGGNLDRYNEMLNKAIAGDPQAKMELAQHSLGTAMGTIKAPESAPKMVPKGTFKNKYNVDAYHGTKADIEEFSPDALGASTGAQSARKAYFFAEDPSTAGDYANLSNSRADLRRQVDPNAPDSPISDMSAFHAEEELRTLKSGTPEAWKSYLDQLKQGQQSLQDKLSGKIPRGHQPIDYIKQKLIEYPDKIADVEHQMSKEGQKIRTDRMKELQDKLDAAKLEKEQQQTGQNVLPVKLRMENPYIHDFKDMGYRDDSYSNIIDKAKAAGHDSVVFKNTYDPADRENRVLQNIYAVFEPHQIRSKFADFDPKKAKSGKISYAAGGEIQNYAEGSPEGVQPPQAAPQPIAPPAETHVVNQWGEIGTLPTEDVQGATTDGGYTLATPEQIHDYNLQKTYGTPGQELKGAAESIAQGIAGPAAPAAEKKYLGVKDADIRGRAEANPKIHLAGEIAGLIAPAFLPGGTATGLGKLTQAGLLESAGKATEGMISNPKTLSGKMGATAAKAAVENMLLAGSDEASKVILNDPNTSAEHAIANIGLAGVLGGAIGGGIGAISPLLKGPLSRVGQEIENFKGRIAEHTTNPDPVATMGDELTNYLNEMNKVSHETYGSSGIKAEAIQKLMPEMTEDIATQANGIADNLDSSLQKLAEQRDPHAPLLQDKIQRFKQALNTDDPATIFDATQTLKQQLQAESRYVEGMTPLSERLYRNTVKNLAHDLRTSLEDRTVWGKAADVQASVNSATSKYIAATKDFKGLLTTKVMGESTIDPGRINTYLNQLGKASAEIKQAKLQNFLDHGDELKNAVSKAYESIGSESPIQPTPLNYTLSTLGTKTAGSKLADIFIKKGLTDVGGKAMGGVLGGGLGHMMGGHGAIGALIGQHALGPFFSSVLPGIAKAIVSNPASSLGFKAAVDHGLAVAKSEAMMTKAAKNVFKVGSEAVADANATNLKQREKLDKILRGLQKTPAALLNNSDKTGHYLPAHAQAISQTTMTAINYLNSLRTDTQKKSPLDSTPVLSAPQRAAYNNALDVANKPLIILDKLKNGTLTAADITNLHSIYPALYDRMKVKLMEQIVNSEAKDTPIPYKTRQSLSLFLGQPLDSTMTPASIMAIQAIQSGKQQNAQDQQQPPSAPKRSTSSLTKMPGMYKTPAQTTEGRRTRE